MLLFVRNDTYISATLKAAGICRSIEDRKVGVSGSGAEEA
jgi:hypothetical protein